MLRMLRSLIRKFSKKYVNDDKDLFRENFKIMKKISALPSQFHFSPYLKYADISGSSSVSEYSKIKL